MSEAVGQQAVELKALGLPASLPAAMGGGQVRDADRVISILDRALGAESQ